VYPSNGQLKAPSPIGIQFALMKERINCSNVKEDPAFNLTISIE
jgi:hypothetical protein